MQNTRESRFECPNGSLIVFDNLGFAIDYKSFNKINDKESMKERCSKCEDQKECGKKDLVANLMKI